LDPVVAKIREVVLMLGSTNGGGIGVTSRECRKKLKLNLFKKEK